jgi:hypothetical protein
MLPRDASPGLIADVALEPGGVLRGQVVDSQQAPLAGEQVLISQQGRVVSDAQTDGVGRFAAENLRGGIYEVEVRSQSAPYRLWASETAPPAARPAVLLVAQEQTVRGQACGGCGQCAECAGPARPGPLRRILTNPWVWAGGIAAAIAIPLALDDDDDAVVQPNGS